MASLSLLQQSHQHKTRNTGISGKYQNGYLRQLQMVGLWVYVVRLQTTHAWLVYLGNWLQAKYGASLGRLLKSHINWVGYKCNIFTMSATDICLATKSSAAAITTGCAQHLSTNITASAPITNGLVANHAKGKQASCPAWCAMERNKFPWEQLQEISFLAQKSLRA